MNKEFALFLDDSGSPKPNPKDKTPYFAMGGVIVERDKQRIIKEKVDSFKKKWNIPLDNPLHGNEIRSKKKKFAWLNTLNEDEYNQFMNDLTNLIITSPIIVHACVISRQGYFNRYLEKYGPNTWELMKSGFSILVERAAKYVNLQGGQLMIYYERMGKKEDKLLESYFQTLRNEGTPFNPQTSSKYNPMDSGKLSDVLRGIEGKTKQSEALQIADLCLYPVAQNRFTKNNQNRAYQELLNNSKLVDSHISPETIKSIGIKYYCFDNT